MHTHFFIFFHNFFWAGPSSAHVAGLGPTGSLAQASDPAGQKIKSRVNWSRVREH
jgi:hypothetical protein